jgi:hypothetical protein
MVGSYPRGTPYYRLLDLPGTYDTLSVNKDDSLEVLLVSIQNILKGGISDKSRFDSSKRYKKG